MYIKKTVILTIALLLSLSMSAQKRKKHVVKKPVVEEPQEDPRITSMREMTQQIIIIDSIVADKDQLLSQLRLSDETGRIVSSVDFFGEGDSTTVFINEMGNKAYLSQPDDSLHQQLCTSDLLGGEWSKPQLLKGISEGISEAAYPFMLADGTTFYFAGKGEESIGGYDIFMTRYDARSNSFLKPENIGMPFNSEANDYMYAIDEANRIGYFVSDRRQPEGKVCIYIFIPSETRKTYNAAKFTEEQIRSFADITSIADTWGNGAERKAALDRIKSRYSAIDVPGQMVSTGDEASAVEYHSIEAKSLYQSLLKEQNSLDIVNSRLEQLRQKYHMANANERRQMKSEILKLEEDAIKLYANVKRLDKATRNAEIKSKKQ